MFLLIPKYLKGCKNQICGKVIASPAMSKGHLNNSPAPFK